jgi:IS605 OrfB family transposase
MPVLDPFQSALYQRLQAFESNHWIIPKRLPRLKFPQPLSLIAMIICMATISWTSVAQGSTPGQAAGDGSGHSLAIAIGGSIILGLILRYVIRSPSQQPQKPQLDTYQIAYLAGGASRAIDLAITRLVHQGYLRPHVPDRTFVIEKPLAPEAPVLEQQMVIGVDFGRRDIAVTSEGERWDGKEIQQVRDRFSRVRALLQSKASKGTRSSRRRCRQLLKRLSGRERRYQQWLNHNISKQVIESAKTNNAAIAIEDLTGIRERTNQQPRDKTERRRSNSWTFYQLRLFLEYKAVKAGVDLVAVPPAYTSQTCHACNHIGLRSGKRFQCSNCGWHGDADLNGAINISKLGAVFVSQPRGSNLCCSLNCDGSGLLQNSLMLCVGESPRASAGG